MGIIVDQNVDEEVNDSWALVSDTLVTNIISCNLAFINTIQASYDYLVDISVGEQECGVGYIYDDVNDTFSAPPTDWVEMIRSNLNNIHSQILTTLGNAAQGSSQNVLDACSASVSDSSPTYATDESDLFDAICAYVVAQGAQSRPN